MQSTVVNFEATYTQIAAASVPSNELAAIAQHLQTSILTYTGSGAMPTLDYVAVPGDPALYNPVRPSGRRHLLAADIANPASAWDASYWSNSMQVTLNLIMTCCLEDFANMTGIKKTACQLNISATGQMACR